ncbi:cyanophycinase [Merismopedia glauca]|uniref:Cyanophycinase n=1 Tax=Merismopedia glauca CCAP 1448/3 TaxID=1296344 RepID=A0A2T1C0C4_9CYAN|nr:cyanophycinase [Merismopedia glauca]PSB01720.1 cyanophycinase [Merismopedia glauca CCAP 1448/3]
MIQVASQIHVTETPRFTKTAILVIGGAEDKVHGREILHTFFCRSGDINARIGIIPSASREPAVIGDRYQTIFAEMGAEKIQVFDIREREQASDPQIQKDMEECTGVFMTGGDQLRLWGILAETPLMERLRHRVWRGELTLAGTSAGAAVMGHHMIAGGGSGESPNRSLVDMATGLGLIPEAIVDQHFHNRNRMSRLLSAIAAYPDKIGIGIDEDTCALFERDGILNAIGKGTVTIVDACQLSRTNYPGVAATDPISLHNVSLHVLCHGDRYNMKERSVVY